MDALSYIKKMDLEESHIFFEEMSNSSCYLSMIKGFIAEYEFKKNVMRRGWLCEKIQDKEKKFRYDFDTLNNKNLYRIEVKLLSSKNSANAGFKDPRNILLPTGKWWRTRCRHKTQDFDFLALYDGSHFHLSSFGILKPLIAKDLKQTKKHEAVILTDDEREWIRENYVDSNVKIKDFSKCLRLKDLE